MVFSVLNSKLSAISAVFLERPVRFIGKFENIFSFLSTFFLNSPDYYVTFSFTILA